MSITRRKNSPVFIIAEAGVNHNGSLRLAKRLVDVASDSGADAVKFQTFHTEELMTKESPKAAYQRLTTSSKESAFNMLKRLQLNYEDHKLLKKHCHNRGIAFMSTPFDNLSVNLLARLGVKFWKVSSGDITNIPLLLAIARQKGEIIISTGMAEIKETDCVLKILNKAGVNKRRLILLQCTSAYPTPYKDVNLRAMMELNDRYGVRVGFSDHTLGMEASVAAAALGANVIEKHITLSRELPGPDHMASLEPKEFRDMVSMIRHVTEALGNGIKMPSDSELKNRIAARKSIVAKTPIQSGEFFNENNLTVKRPGNGLSPLLWKQIIGRKSLRNFKIDQPITL